MKKLILSIALVLMCAGARGEGDTLKYRVCLKDKAVTEYSLKKPEDFLSRKSIERRLHQNLAIDSTDLPVCKKYVDEICRLGAHVVVTGKWENFVTVSCNDTMLASRMAALPFVRSVELVWKAPAESNKGLSAKRDTLINHPTVYPDSTYGTAFRQIAISRGDRLHAAGFRGQGMTVAVIDGGFLNADAIPLLQNVKIEGTRNFVHPGWDVYAELDHGMSVLSCMAANHPYTLVGTAPEASYWLFCSEDPDCECLAEEDYWAQAVEYADSVGVDVVNTSLGYYAFDDRSKNYRYRDLDGRTSLMTRSASMAADKGMIVVCSAGNSGDKQWKKITPPADADHVLTVGAVDARGMNTTFSSVGYTADGRVKPDVMARGGHTALIRPNGRVSAANGTSFSAPVLCGGVACLWQACPQLTAKEIMELVRRSGDRFECPDNIFGYGIPSLWKAYLNANR